MTLEAQTDDSRAETRRRWINIAIWAGVLGVLAAALSPLFRAVGVEWAAGRVRPHAPDMALFLAQDAAIQIHIVAAVASFLVGLVMLARPKGDKLHRAIGWSWVVLMSGTALSSLFITELNGNFYSFIHLISGWTLIALPMAIYLVRQGKVRQHARTMVGLFVGGMLIAGGLTLLPGRLMWALFLG